MNLPNLNRVTKWRAIFAGWQLGTRPKGDPECDAVRDHREATIIHRVELTTIIGLLLAKGVITEDEWIAELEKEADLLSMAYEARFPGIRAVDNGIEMDARAIDTMRGWKP